MNLPRLSVSIRAKFEYGESPRVLYDWSILLALAAILLLASAAFNIWLYRAAAGGMVLGGVPAATTTPRANTSAISKVQAIFEMRSSEAAKYTNGAYTFIDPSQ